MLMLSMTLEPSRDSRLSIAKISPHTQILPLSMVTSDSEIGCSAIALPITTSALSFTKGKVEKSIFIRLGMVKSRLYSCFGAGAGFGGSGLTAGSGAGIEAIRLSKSSSLTDKTPSNTTVTLVLNSSAISLASAESTCAF